MKWKTYSMMLTPWMAGLAVGCFMDDMPSWLYYLICLSAGGVIGWVSQSIKLKEM